MAKYKKRADGRYATRITLDTPNGKQVRTVYGRTIKDLENNILKLRTQEGDRSLINSSVTVEEWSNIWLETYKKPTVSYNTYKGYKIAVKDHIIPALGDKRLSELRANHLQTVLSELCNKDQVPTARKVKIAMVGIIKTAVKEKYVRDNIADELELAGHKPKEKRALTEKEETAILSADLTEKERAFVDLLYYTGIRKGEALALTPQDVDFEKKTITINKVLIWRINQAELKNSTKSEAGRRVLPLPDKLAVSLKKVAGNGVLFGKENDGEYMSDTVFRHMWERIRKKCSVKYGGELPKDITPHLFRHNYATKLYNAGVDVKTAQYLLGHSSIQVTLGIYTHLANSDTSKTFDMVNNIF